MRSCGANHYRKPNGGASLPYTFPYFRIGIVQAELDHGITFYLDHEFEALAIVPNPGPITVILRLNVFVVGEGVIPPKCAWTSPNSSAWVTAQ